MTRLRLKPYADQSTAWPDRGRVIMAQYDDDSIVVYQAFSPAIGQQAARLGKFGDAFSLNRMSWIKPGFLWMMHRCEWGTAKDQECVLAIWIKRTDFDSLLPGAVHSLFAPEVYPSEQAWKDALATSEVRMQFDPDYDPRGIKIKRRAIQLGLSGQTLRRYAQEWILHIEDITPYVRQQSKVIRTPALMLTPTERIYPVRDAALAARLGLDKRSP
jgi:hypothetical protein